jgi:hypothetical protein
MFNVNKFIHDRRLPQFQVLQGWKHSPIRIEREFERLSLRPPLLTSSTMNAQKLVTMLTVES